MIVRSAQAVREAFSDNEMEHLGTITAIVETHSYAYVRARARRGGGGTRVGKTKAHATKIDPCSLHWPEQAACENRSLLSIIFSLAEAQMCVCMYMLVVVMYHIAGKRRHTGTQFKPYTSSKVESPNEQQNLMKINKKNHEKSPLRT